MWHHAFFDQRFQPFLNAFTEDIFLNTALSSQEIAKQKSNEGQKTYDCQIKSMLFPPEKRYGAKVNPSINSPLSFSWNYRDLAKASCN